MPSAPLGFRVSGTQKGILDIKWDEPESDGGAKILGYHIEKSELSSKLFAASKTDMIYDLRWTRCGTVDYGMNEFSIMNLKTSNIYLARVAAFNVAGVGQFAELQEPVAAKNKNCKFFEFYLIVFFF